MIQVELGQEERGFVSFIENTLSKLAEEKYDIFLSMFDSSRISEDGLILALRFLDEDLPAIKIDNPMKVKFNERHIDIGQYKNGSGYWMDYDLTTNGQPNDLTVQVKFLKQDIYYFVSLEDLHTL